MPPAKTLIPQAMCPCGSQNQFGNCCLPYLEKRASAPTAEALMRSRYTAHVLLHIDYLWDTWSSPERNASGKNEIYAWANSCEWLELRILDTQSGQRSDNQGMVTFNAFFMQGGQKHQHHEISLFRKHRGNWLYVGHH